MNTIHTDEYTFKKNNITILDDWTYKCGEKLSRFQYLMKDLINSYTDVRKKKIDSLRNFPINEVANWHRVVLSDREEHTKLGHNFNIFSLFNDNLHIPIRETMHSRLIKFLLDKNESHGQGSLFLIEFLKMIGIESPEKGSWLVTAEIGRIDVKIERKYPQSVILIENKSNGAQDQPHQLYRYWYQAIYNKTKKTCEQFYQDNNHKYQFIYLTPQNNRIYEKHSITKPKEYIGDLYKYLPDKLPIEVKEFTFDKHVRTWLDNCISVLPATNHRIREYIIQYQFLCSNL